MDGRLCISVIEAANVSCEEGLGAPLDFYVRLRLGHAEVKTDVMHDCITPKFLKDVRMEVPDAQADVLRIELLQCGPRGDLVVGSDQLQVASITDKGTVVHWFQLKAADEELAAELCMVLRYLPAANQRSMTPSYGIAAREAKQRALEGSAGEAQSAMRPSKALFSDLHTASDQKEEQQQHAASAASFAPATPAKLQLHPFGRADLPITGGYAPLSAGDTSSPLNQSTSSLTGLEFAETDDDRHTSYTRGSSRAASPAPRRTDSTVLDSPRAAAAALGRHLSPGLAQARRVAGARLPWPLAAMGGMLAGALVFLVKNRPLYDEDTDTVCAIGSCVNKSDVSKLRRREEWA